MAEARGPAAVVRRLLPAAPEAVYDEWLDPGALADWMCPRPARCRDVQLEPRVGGRLRIDIEDGGAEFYVTGTFLVLDRPRLLSFSWSCSTWPDPGIRSVVNVLLEPRGSGQTLMTIEHTLLPPELVDQHARGWAAIADQLAAELRRPGVPGRETGARKLALVVRTDLGMGRGKIAAQAAHAAAALADRDGADLASWCRQGQPKVVLKASTAANLQEVIRQARAIGLPVEVIHDAGRTQVRPGTVTCCAVGPADSDLIDSVTAELPLL